MRLKIFNTGFTLIELLVVIGIMAALLVVALPQIGNFQKGQVLEQAQQELLTIIRTAQANAASGVKCGAEFNPQSRAASWFVMFNSNNIHYTLRPACVPPPWIPIQTKGMPIGTSIFEIWTADNNNNKIEQCSNAGTRISFANISAQTSFRDFLNNCDPNQANVKKLVIFIEATSTGDQAGVVIEKGGTIYACAVNPSNVNPLDCPN